jgi:hypothetical protein
MLAANTAEATALLLEQGCVVQQLDNRLL